MRKTAAQRAQAAEFVQLKEREKKIRVAGPVLWHPSRAIRERSAGHATLRGDAGVRSDPTRALCRVRNNQLRFIHVLSVMQPPRVQRLPGTPNRRGARTNHEQQDRRANSRVVEGVAREGRPTAEMTGTEKILTRSFGRKRRTKGAG